MSKTARVIVKACVGIFVFGFAFVPNKENSPAWIGIPLVVCALLVASVCIFQAIHEIND